MNPRRTTNPASEPLTLTEAKLHLRVDGTDEDAYITTLIEVARVACEQRLQRTLITSGWTLNLDSFPAEIELPMVPVLTVTSVSYLDTAGATQTIDAADYQVNIATEPGEIVPAPGVSWPLTSEKINAVTVVYTAGYGATAASVPAPIRQWLLLAIGDMYANREASSDKPAVKQRFCEGLLDSYTMWGI